MSANTSSATITPHPTEEGLHRGTNWWGAFALGLAGTILVTGIAPYAVQSLGAASIPLFVVVTAMGVLLCLFLAELAAMMPERTGGLPSYASATFSPLGASVSRHVGGLSAWSYWLGWFPVAPINMILASAYIVDLLHIPQGRTLNPFGSVGAPITVGVLLVSAAGILLMFVPAYFGIKLGSGFATALGLASMVPLTALVLLPLVRPHSLHWSNLSGFHLPAGVHGSFTFFMAWIFVMTWSVLAMEAAACYIGECENPQRDAKIAMTVEGGYGFLIYALVPVMLVAVLGSTTSIDPLIVFRAFAEKVLGTGAAWVHWAVGVPLVIALLLSVLNAIMGVGRSLFQVSRDGLLPRWFGRANRHGSPGNAMAFNVVASLLVLLFGSPVRIYIFSNLGYLLALLLAMIGYFVYAQYRPSLARPVRIHRGLRWLALAIGVFWAFIWAYGGWNSPALVVGSNSHSLFLIGLAVLVAYLPLYAWRRLSDRRTGVTAPSVALATEAGEA